MMGWFTAHRMAFTGTLNRLAGAPLTTLFNIAVIGTALALPTGFYVLLTNLQGLAQQYAPEPQVSLFLAAEAAATDVRNIEDRIKAHAGVASFRYVPRAQALETLRTRAGLADLLAGLALNPLPDGFVVIPAAGNASALEALRGEFKTWPKVAEVHVDSDWARRLDNLLAIGRYAVLMLAAALAFALIAITFNTIRLQILTQRDEIEVTKLIGATDAYIRRPFLYLGTLIGGTGGLAAWVMVWGALQIFNRQLAALAELYGIPLALTHLGATDSAYTLLFAAWLGWFGAWLSVRRHLIAYDPL